MGYDLCGLELDENNNSIRRFFDVSDTFRYSCLQENLLLIKKTKQIDTHDLHHN